jgi:peptidoglycan/LPS O-acetylase OafA/YrhL
MERHSLTVIWLATLALPIFIFLVGSSRKSRSAVLAFAAAAVLAGWVLTLAYANVAQAITARVPEDLNGAALAFATMFGWVPAAVIVLITWAAVAATKHWLRPNNSSKPTPLRGASQLRR